MSRGFILAAFASTMRRVGGEIAVRRIARRGHLDVGEVEPGRQRTVGLQRLQRVEDAAVHERVDVHREPTFASD